MSLRQLKKQVMWLFQTRELPAAMSVLVDMPARRVVNPLFGLLYHGDPRVRWYAIAAMGQVVSRLAEGDMESARVIMRRLMWNLNDESGGMGWGSPEAMGEIMACQPRLAEEYASILVSYLNPDGNFLEHEGLQAGALWAVGRLARAHPHLVTDAPAFITPHFASPNAALRGMALWAARPLSAQGGDPRVQGLTSDGNTILLFEDGALVKTTISALAAAL
jgi:hypothetical protein